ncbi:MAG: mycofactocin biosynthesis glycosyltransferase MftF [Microthrixaceae bacterium]
MQRRGLRGHRIGVRGGRGDDRHVSGPDIVADASLRRVSDNLFVGGSPRRLFHMAGSGTAILTRLIEGRAWTPQGAAEEALAGRLVDADAAHPVVVDGAAALAAMTVVVPVRDDEDGLGSLLEALSGVQVGGVVVVDDGSVDDRVVAALAQRHGAVLVRNGHPLGPAAARNEGLGRVGTRLAVFIDADVALPAGGGPARILAMLAGHFECAGVVAVAPRVRGAAGDGLLADYDEINGPLDMGDTAATVGPGRRVSYVPSAVLVVDVDAVRAVGAFDDSLRHGEDVDLVWRLVRQGGRVMYEPAVEVLHRPRGDLVAWLSQRFGYGTSAAPLAVRHRGDLAPVRVNPSSAALWMSMAAGHPGVAVLIGAAAVRRLVRGGESRSGLPVGVATRLVWEGNLAVGRSIAVAMLRPWFPVTALACVVSRRARKVALAAVALRIATTPGRPRVRVLRLADDLAYSAGVWAGALRARDLGAVLPRLTK